MFEVANPLFFPLATFFGQERVPHVEHTGENSQNTDKHTEHLNETERPVQQKTQRKYEGGSGKSWLG